MGMRVVVAAANEAREAENFERHNDSFITALLRMQFLTFLASAAPGMCSRFQLRPYFSMEDDWLSRAISAFR